MSGQAGASIEGAHYSIFVGTGVNVSYEPPPGDDGSAIGRYFDEESQPYRLWLARARPGLDALFADLIAEGAPIVALKQKFHEIQGTIIERPDRDEQHFRQYYRGGPLVVRLRGGRRMPGVQSLELHFLVSGRVARSLLEPILDRVAEVLLSCRA